MNLRKEIREMIREQKFDESLNDHLVGCLEHYASGNFEEMLNYEWTPKQFIQQARDYIDDNDKYQEFVKCCNDKMLRKEIREALREQKDDDNFDTELMKKYDEYLDTGAVSYKSPKITKKRPFSSLTMDDLIKFAGGVENIKARNKTSDDAYIFLQKAHKQLIDKRGERFEEVEELDPTMISDWCDNNF